MCEEHSTRIIVGSEESYYSDTGLKDDAYYIDNDLSIGRIEICSQGIWNLICQDTLTDNDASVACFQMGFSRFGNLLGRAR